MKTPLCFFALAIAAWAQLKFPEIAVAPGVPAEMTVSAGTRQVPMLTLEFNGRARGWGVHSLTLETNHPLQNITLVVDGKEKARLADCDKVCVFVSDGNAIGSALDLNHVVQISVRADVPATSADIQVTLPADGIDVTCWEDRHTSPARAIAGPIVHVVVPMATLYPELHPPTWTRVFQFLGGLFFLVALMCAITRWRSRGR